MTFTSEARKGRKREEEKEKRKINHPRCSNRKDKPERQKEQRKIVTLPLGQYLLSSKTIFNRSIAQSHQERWFGPEEINILVGPGTMFDSRAQIDIEVPE